MKIAYCTNVRLPSERAHGHQVAAVCDALVGLGHAVTIFTPFRQNIINDDYWSYHKADRRVKVKHLGSFDPIDRWWIPKFFQLPVLNVLFQRAMSREFRVSSFELVYTRTPALLSTLLHKNIPVILELHTLPNRGRSLFVRQCNRCALVVCLTTPMKDELVQWGVDADRIIVEPDAVDDTKFMAIAPRKQDVFRVGYAGSLTTMGHDKGVLQIVEAVDRLRTQGKNITKCIAGGPASVMQTMRNADPHPEEYVGFLNQQELQDMYASCSVLVYPAPQTSHPYFMRDTSPLKVFEYMAVERPIIAANIPPIHDILDDKIAYFFQPGNSEDLARVIEYIMAHPDEAAGKARLARQAVEQFTWGKRMERILQKIV